MHYENIIDTLSGTIENLREKHVPDMGNCPTEGGEIIRALDRLVYRFYNDGDIPGIDYGIQTCNSSYRYLRATVPNCPELNISCSQEDYEESLARLTECVVDYLLDNPELFEKDNTADSRKPSSSDWEEMRRWENADEDDDWY